MSSRRLRIAIDARYLSHGLMGGVHTYVKELTTTLLSTEPHHDYVFWIDSKRPHELPATATNIRSLHWSSGASSVRNDLRIGKAMAADGADIAHFPGNYGFAPRHLPVVITLHDAINLLPLHQIWRSHAKSARTIATMTYLHVMTRRSVAQQPFVVTVSEFSRQEILRQSTLPPDHVHVVYGAVDRRFRPIVDRAELDDLRLRLQLQQHVLLADAIKNPMCVLNAYRGLPDDLRASTSLVFFSRRAPMADVEHAASIGECTLLIQPGRQELVNLFSIADIFVFPSWYEGFGLPAAEAMACGTPVIASSRGSLPEVVGSGGVIVDADDHVEVAARMTSLLRNPDQRQALAANALQRASLFTPNAQAAQMIEIYEDVASRSIRHTNQLQTHPA